MQVGYTDSAQPDTAYDTTPFTDMPLGTHVDAAGTAHTSRLYATFDLSQFTGTHAMGGTVFVHETGAADCTKRAIELWRTRPIRKTPTWRGARCSATRSRSATRRCC